MQAQAATLSAANAGLSTYSTAATALLGVLLLTNWPSYNYLIHGGTNLIWFHLLPVLLMLPIVFAQPSLAFRVTKDPLTWWLGAYVVSGLLWMMLSQDFIEQAAIQWRARLLAFGLFFTITILFRQANLRVVGWVIVACVAFACASAWFDVLRPHRFVPVGHEFSLTGRGAGFFVNPNVAGSFMAMATVVVLPFIPMRFRAILILCAVIGIVATFSRSAFVYAGLVMLGAIMLKLLNRSQTLLIVVVTPLLVLATAASYDFLMSSSDVTNLNDVVRRLEWFQGGQEEDEAAAGRLYGAASAWRLFLDAPLTGRGTGITSLMVVVGEGPHNMYLMLMAEHGFLGLVLYPALIVILTRRGRQLARNAPSERGREIGHATVLYAVFLCAYGFFSHNVLDEPQSLFIMAFIAAAAMNAPRVAALAAAPITGSRRPHLPGAVRPRVGRF